jgi:hypothetical protein
MQGLASKFKVGAAGVSGGLLAGQMLFAVAFVGTCEVPNFMSPRPATNACLERWMAVSALFIPSGLNSKQLSAPTTTRRRTTATRRSTSTRSAAKK